MTPEPTPLAESLRTWQAGHGLRVVPPAEIEHEIDVELADEAARIERDALLRRWHRSVPQRFHRARLSDFDERLAWFEPVVAWSERSDMRRNAVIIGPVGTGKSHLAAAMCRPACAAGLDVRMIGTAKLLDMLRPGGPDGALDRLIDIDRLIIDDVGAEKPTDWTAERFTLLVDERWSEERPTVFTTNLAPPDLAAHVGERCYSRMVGGALAVELTGADRRRAR